MSDGLDLLAHWWCPTCGTFDGPITGEACDVCADQCGDAEEIERLASAEQLRGAVSALEEIARRADEPGFSAYGARNIARAALASLNQPGGRS